MKTTPQEELRFLSERFQLVLREAMDGSHEALHECESLSEHDRMDCLIRLGIVLQMFREIREVIATAIRHADYYDGLD